MERLVPVSARVARAHTARSDASSLSGASRAAGTASNPTLRSLASPRISPSGGAALPWWLRSRLFGAPAVSLRLPRPATVIRWLAALLAAVAALSIVSRSMHPPLGVPAGHLFAFVSATAPLATAAVVALCVLRPALALPVVLLLVPFWDAAQVSWAAGEIQVILQTVFVVALASGAAFEALDRTTFGRAPRRLRAALRLRPVLLGAGAAAALVALAVASTLASPHPIASFTVLLHGILEPAAMALFALAFTRTRRQLVVLLSVLGLSVALGSAFNLAQTVPATPSLSTLQAQRLLFARLTYFNVGLFGEMLAMAAPLLLGALALRGPFSSNRWARAGILFALAVALVALYLTFSKSAWLSTFAAVVTLFVLLARSWRRRGAILAAIVLISALAIPWPAALLRPVAPPLANAYQGAMVGLVGQSRYDSWDPAKLAGRGSLLERFYAAEAAVRMSLDHPALGIGLDQFQSLYVSTYRPPQAKLSLDSAHSFWPEIAAELGLPALAATVLVFAGALLSAAYAYRRAIDEQARRLAAIVIASLVAWLAVASMFAGDMYRPWRNMASDFLMMAVLVGVALALPRLAGSRREPAK